MCWSFEVTLFFVVLEVACVVFLFARNQLNDRLNCALQFPLLAQEVVQLFLWAELPHGCSERNHLLSITVQTVVCLVPLWLQCVVISTFTSQTKTRLVLGVYSRRLYSIGFAASCVLVMYYDILKFPRCTTVRPTYTHITMTPPPIISTR